MVALDREQQRLGRGHVVAAADPDAGPHQGRVRGGHVGEDPARPPTALGLRHGRCQVAHRACGTGWHRGRPEGQQLAALGAGGEHHRGGALGGRVHGPILPAGTDTTRDGGWGPGTVASLYLVSSN